MSLIEEARERKRPKGQPCTLGTFLASLADTERAEVCEALAERALSSTAIRDALVNRGHEPPKPQVIQRHRRGECRCG